MDEPSLEVVLSALEDLDADEEAVETAVDVVADPYARRTLRHLEERSPTSLDRLAGAIAGTEAVSRGEVVTPTEYDHIRVRLYHDVLPKLEADDCARFDPKTRTVSRTSLPPAVSALLDLEDDPPT